MPIVDLDGHCSLRIRAATTESYRYAKSAADLKTTDLFGSIYHHESGYRRDSHHWQPDVIASVTERWLRCATDRGCCGMSIAVNCLATIYSYSAALSSGAWSLLRLSCRAKKRREALRFLRRTRGRNVRGRLSYGNISPVGPARMRWCRQPWRKLSAGVLFYSRLVNLTNIMALVMLL